MSFKAEDFYEQAFQRDFSRKFQMRVINIGGLIGPDDNVLITTANLPGYELNNVKVPFMGMDFNLPASGHYPGSDSWKVSFRCDLNFDIRTKLESWQQQIFTAAKGQSQIPGIQEGSTGAYHIPGLDQSIRLALHNRSGDFYRQYVLLGCYPKTLGEMSYDQTDKGEIVMMDVTLAYQWWELETTPIGNNADLRFDGPETSTGVASI